MQMANSNAKFIEYVTELRANASREVFFEQIQEWKQVDRIINLVLSNNDRWAEKVGLNKKKKDASEGLSEAELQWKTFFQDHSFDSTNDIRNFADAFSIITQLDLSRFLTIVKESTDRFPAYISIVPSKASNSGHNYKLGDPIISIQRGSAFYRINGTSGNSMTTNVNEYRMSTKEEVRNIILCILHKLAGGAEHFVYNLLDNEEVEEDE
jgi:hypothetical protein